VKKTSWIFPSVLAGLIILLQAAQSLLLYTLTPPHARWLGIGLASSSDAAVYYSYLNQVAEGGIKLHNLFAIEPGLSRFDPFWSSLGLVARFTGQPYFVFESARWLFIAFLVFVVYFIARRTTERPRLAAFLAFLGIGTGWFYTLYIHAFGAWQINTPLAPDVSSELSLSYIVTAAPHIILSASLLILTLWFLWNGLKRTDFKSCLWAGICAAALCSFHPYFLPLILIYAGLTLLRFGFRGRLTLLLPLILPLAASVAVYLPLLADKDFVAHHAVANRLPLAPAVSWILFTLPFAVAFIYRWRKKIRLRPEEEWLMAWIVAVLIFLLLPVPWKRKGTEALGLALVWLGMPAWTAVADWIKKSAFRPLKILLAALLLLAAGLTPAHFIVSQFYWAADPVRAAWFYRPQELFSAWSSIKAERSPDCVVVSDDLWVNVWTPANTLCRVWVGHDHETPDFARKKAEWKTAFESQDPTLLEKWLTDSGITHLILTTQDAQTRYAPALLQRGWKIVFAQGSVIFLRRTPDTNL